MAERTSAVVTAPFSVGGPQTLIRGLQALLDLPVETIYLVYDRKGVSGDRARAALEYMKPDLEAHQKLVRLVEADTSETAHRWRYGIVAALADGSDAAFLFPGDMESEPTPENHNAWQRMLAAAASNTLVLGDYDTIDPFKREYDELVVYPMIERLYGADLKDRVRALGVSKLRTEFLIVGREVFQTFEAGSAAWSADPTIQLILFVCDDPRFGITRAHLGDFKDRDSTRKPLGQMHQLFRLFAALSTDRINKEREATAEAHVTAQLDAYDSLSERVGDAFDDCRLAWRSNTRRLYQSARSVSGTTTRPFTTNPKVAGLEPSWASFRGFSYLFDPVDRDLVEGPGPGVQTIRCQVDLLGEDLYAALRRVLEGPRLRELVDNHLFCRLPPTSYHVTVWDGINDSNLRRVQPDAREGLGQLLEELPASLGRPLPTPWLTSQWGLPDVESWSVRFGFRRLSLWGEQVLVAELQAADPESETTLAMISDRRRWLDEQAKIAWGLPPGSKYAPHVSLGYFPNRTLARSARADIARWDEDFAADVGSATKEFHSARLYGFRDMITFSKATERGHIDAQ